MPQYLDQPATTPTEHEQMPPCGSRLSVSCTNSTRPSKPLRISVWPAASQTRVPLGPGSSPALALRQRLHQRRYRKGSTDPEIRIWPPLANPIPITPAFSAEVGKTAAASGVTATGLNTAGIWVRLQSC
jgi:hypothetical protein